MKKLNIFCIIIGIICFLVAGYIVTDKILVTEDNKIEIDEETYNDWKDKDEDALGDLILDMIDRNDPQDWEIDSVDDFEPVEEDAQEDND